MLRSMVAIALALPLAVGCSSGAGKVAVPNVVGKTQPQAARELSTSHLVPKYVPAPTSTGSPTASFPSRRRTLVRLAKTHTGISCGGGAPTYLVSFSDTSHQVDLVEFCGEVTNGEFAAAPTPKWLAELRTPHLGTP